MYEFLQDLRVVKPCSVVILYQHFGGLHLQVEVSGAGIEITFLVFWVVTPCIVVVGYRRFGGPCYLHLKGEYLDFSPYRRESFITGFIYFYRLDFTQKLLVASGTDMAVIRMAGWWTL